MAQARVGRATKRAWQSASHTAKKKVEFLSNVQRDGSESLSRMARFAPATERERSFPGVSSLALQSPHSWRGGGKRERSEGKTTKGKCDRAKRIEREASLLAFFERGTREPRSKRARLGSAKSRKNETKTKAMRGREEPQKTKWSLCQSCSLRARKTKKARCTLSVRKTQTKKGGCQTKQNEAERRGLAAAVSDGVESERRFARIHFFGESRATGHTWRVFSLRARVWRRGELFLFFAFFARERGRAAKPDEKTARQRVVLFETPKTPRKTCLSLQREAEKKTGSKQQNPPKKKRRTSKTK